MKKNVLIVGGAGYVGGAVTDLLLHTPHALRVYDALLYEEAYQKPIECIRGDIRDRDKLLPHLEWADVVVWLAAIVGDGACALYPDVTRQVNEESVRWLTSVYDGRIIFPSTSMVYGAQGGELSEQASLAPVSLYAQTKAYAEAMLEKKQALIFRFGTLFGIGDAYTRMRFDLVVHLFVRAALTGHPITIFGGEQMRAMLHVRDAAQMIVSQCDATHAGIFNLHHENVSVRAIAECVARVLLGTKIELQPPDTVVSGNYCLSSATATTVLGFQPTRTLEQGVSELAEHLRKGGLNNFYDSRYSNEAFLRTHPVPLWKNHD